jgi:chromate transporter
MIELIRLSWVFFKIGLFCWGGGLVIIPMVEREVVWKYGWLTEHEFVDAVTLGQITPGPVVISAAFIGYKACGAQGAVAATASVILPSFILVCLAAKAVKRFEQNRWLMGFFNGARVAVIGTVFDAALSIGRTALTDAGTVVILLLSLVLLLNYRLSPLWLLLGAGCLGVVIS